MFNERIKRPPCLKGAGTACRDWGIIRSAETKLYPSVSLRLPPPFRQGRLLLKSFYLYKYRFVFLQYREINLFTEKVFDFFGKAFTLFIVLIVCHLVKFLKLILLCF